jgi:hypothetical protein
MEFIRLERVRRFGLSGRNEVFLVDDGWDDFHFKTMFDLIVFDDQGQRTEVGQVKIVSRGLKGGRVDIPERFGGLGSEYCSLGQDQNYYETLAALPGDLGDQILRGLRDCVLDHSILIAFRDEPGFRTSLVRYTSETSILTTFTGALKGQARLTPFRFAYTFPQHASSPDEPSISFDVDPESMPPTNVHVVIGRNGVGKTNLLRNIATILCQSRSAEKSSQSGRVDFLSVKEVESVGNDLQIW